MCGINGFLDIRSNSNEEILSRMTSVLAHRGPDGSGIYFQSTDDYTIGLGHRRLSIIDLTEGGTQPMHFGQISVCFNGEIYNFQEIKEELEKLGHTFKTKSDTEMILHAYMEWGINCIDRFIGMFAIALVDNLLQKLFLIRDRAGVKPLFYYRKSELFLFASELKSFHQHPGFEKELNLQAVASFLQYGNVPTPHCIFENCHKIKPGHYLSIDFKTLEATEVKFWDVYAAYNQPKTNLDFDSAKAKTKELLEKACAYRMVADVPVGVFLSGGYDSACVTALLQQNRTEKLQTFTVSVPDIGLDEAPFAKKVANYLGTNHTEIICSEKEATDLITQLPYYYDEPFADSSAIPTTLVSMMAKKHVTVALSADAGDEVFAGYNRYDYLLRYGSKINKIPTIGRKLIAGMMDQVDSNKIPILRNKYNFHNRYEKLKGVLRNPSPEIIMHSLSEQFTDKQLQEICLFHPERLDTAYASKALEATYYSPLAYMMAIDYQTYLVDDILQKVDRATMTASLEGREPFLDHTVIEWAAQLPDQYKYSNGIKKYILREIVHDFLPKEMMDRPKMGFAIPIANWLQIQFKELVEHYLSESKIREQKLFNPTYILQLKTSFFNGKKEFDVKLWYLLMFQMWYEQWMENPKK